MKVLGLLLAIFLTSFGVGGTVVLTGLPAGAVVTGVALETVVAGLAAAAGAAAVGASSLRRGRRDTRDLDLIMKQLEKMDEPSDCGKLLLCKSARSGFARDDKRIEEIIQFLESETTSEINEFEAAVKFGKNAKISRKSCEEKYSKCNLFF